MLQYSILIVFNILVIPTLDSQWFWQNQMVFM